MPDFNNLSNGFLPSTSREICNEIALVFPKVIAEDPIPLEKQGQDHVKIVDVERIKPITQVNTGVWTKFGLQITAATSSDLTSSSSIASAIDFVGQLDLILSRSSLQAKFSPNSS